MVRRLKRTIRLVAWALMLTFGAVVSTECLMAAEMNDAQKACCVAMHHDCGSAAIQQDCCATESSNLTGIVSTAPASLLVGLPLVATSLPATQPVLTTSLRAAAFDSAAPIPSSRPTYLFVSVFRL